MPGFLIIGLIVAVVFLFIFSWIGKLHPNEENDILLYLATLPEPLKQLLKAFVVVIMIFIISYLANH